MSEQIKVADLKAGQRFKDLDKDSRFFGKVMVVNQAWGDKGPVIAYLISDAHADEPISYEAPEELVEVVK